MSRQSKTVDALRKLSLSYPETEESVVCNKSVYKARGKGFLFVGSDDATYNVLLKLRESLPEATQFSTENPAAYRVGSTDWVTIVLPHDKAIPAGLAERWVHESFRLIAPKQLAALVGAQAAPAGRKPAKKKSSKKKA